MFLSGGETTNISQKDMYFHLVFSISDNKLFEFSESYRAKNVSLTVEVERLKRENLDLQVKVESG